MERAREKIRVWMMWDWWAMISERLCWIKAIRGIRCRIVCSHAVWLYVYGLRAWYCGRCSRLPSSSSSSVCVSVTIATKSRRTGWRSLSRSHCRRSIRHLLHRHIYLACQKRKLFPFFEHTHTHTTHEQPNVDTDIKMRVCLINS